MKADGIRKKAEVLLRKMKGFYDGVPAECIFTEEVYRRFTSLLARHLSLEPYTVFRVCVSAANKPRSKALCWKVCYFLTANREALASGRVYPMDGSWMTPGDVEVRCIGVSYESGERLTVECQALTGSVALRHFRLSLTLSGAYRWLFELGFSRRDTGKYPLQAPSEAFPGLYGAVRMSPEEQVQGMTRWSLEFIPYAPAKSVNRKRILNLRNGFEPCPFGKDAAITDTYGSYCAVYCEHGWNTCAASGHEAAYERGTCDCCAAENRLLLPGTFRTCIACKRAEDKITEYE